MYLTRNKYQKQRMQLIKLESELEESSSKWKSAHSERITLDEKWMKQKRELVVSDVRLPSLGDLEKDCNPYGKPMCCVQSIPAAFICCDDMYYLHASKIHAMAERGAYIPVHMELRLIVTIENAAEYTLQQGDEFTMEGINFRMISNNEAIMQNGLKDLESWRNTSYLWGRVISDFIMHKYSDREIGATFIYQPKSIREGY
jgi:hypothetical protein